MRNIEIKSMHMLWSMGAIEQYTYISNNCNIELMKHLKSCSNIADFR